MHDVVVAGGGVAGLAAGLCAARLRCSTLVLVPDIPGGHIATIDHVEDFPGFPRGVAGYELGPAIQEQAMNAGAEFRMAPVEALTRTGTAWSLSTPEGAVEARAVIIASGSRNRPLGVPGEERLTGHGVSHCASCDGPMLRGKPVVVVGAGDSGLQEALTLAGFASTVLVVHHGPAPTAQAVYRERAAAHAHLRTQANTLILEVHGDQTVSGVRLRDTITGEEWTEETAAVFIYAGLAPNTAFVNDLLPLDAAGRIPTDLWMRTEVPGLLAAGDARAGSACQAVSAAGDGATAAGAAHRYLSGSTWRG